MNAPKVYSAYSLRRGVSRPTWSYVIRGFHVDVLVTGITRRRTRTARPARPGEPGLWPVSVALLGEGRDGHVLSVSLRWSLELSLQITCCFQCPSPPPTADKDSMSSLDKVDLSN